MSIPKFKIGDRVRVINEDPEYCENRVDHGSEGTVLDSHCIPRIKWDVNPFAAEYSVDEKELELIPEQLTPEKCEAKAKELYISGSGQGGRSLILPMDSDERKTYPVHSGFMAYFPRAIAAVAHHSWKSNEKHNPGEPLHWSKEKSADHLDCQGRHMLDQLDPNLNEIEEKTACAWRAMADLETALENDK